MIAASARDESGKIATMEISERRTMRIAGAGGGEQKTGRIEKRGN